MIDLQANKMGPEGAAVQELVRAQPEGKTFFKGGQNGMALSSSPITAGSCPLKFPGTSALFWDRVR